MEERFILFFCYNQIKDHVSLDTLPDPVTVSFESK